jgi:hypothetical protein
VEECLVFGHIVGAWLELKLQDIPHGVSFRGYEDDACSDAFEVLGAIEVEGPVFAIRRGGWLLMFLPVDEEICQRLGFDRTTRLVCDVVDAEFDCPLGDSPSRVPIEDDTGKRGRRDNLDGVLVEVGAFWRATLRVSLALCASVGHSKESDCFKRR